MSFNNQIWGPVTSAPAIIYNSTNMSSENISCTNLSGSIATFDQLSVITFNPISFSADYAEITNLSCDNLSVRLRSTMGSISTGNISAAEITLTGDINASEVNASAVNASNIYADDISTSTITCISNISTPRLYVNDTFFYGSTGSIVASLVTMSSQVLYNLGDLDFKIISVSGTQYLTCDNTLGNVNISNLSVDNLAATIGRIEDLRAQDASVFGNVSVYGNVEAIGRVRVGGIDFKESTSGFKVAYLDVNTASMKMYLNKSMEFRKQDNSGIVFMKIDYAKSNINMSNLSCANLSTNLLNNISAGEGISLSTEAVTNKLVITASGELNSSNLSLDNLSTVATSVQEIEYRNNPAGLKSYVSVNSGSVKQYHYSSWQFQKDNDAGIVFMKIDYAAENINISNLSCANLSTNLLNNISAGENITLSTEAGTNKLVITGQGGLNSSNLSLDNLSVTDSFTCNDAQIDDLFNCDMTNSLKAGSNISYPFIDNLSVGFDTSSLDTTIMMNPNIVLYGIELLPDIITAAPPTFEMTAGTAQITNANMSNLSVNNLSVITGMSVPSAIITDITTNRISLEPDQSFTPPIFEMTEGTAQITNANMSNLSVNNLSVLTDITTPAATITDLTITGGGTFNHNLINSLTPGANMSIVSVANKPRIGLNPDINISNMSVDNVSCSGILDVNRINASDIHTDALNVSGSAPFFSDGLTVFGSTTTQNISTGNISAGFITSAGDIRAAGGFRALGGSGIFSTGAIQFNNANDGTGDSLEIYYTGTQFGMGTTSGKDFTINAGYSTGGLVVDGTLNNINMSNCSINNLSTDNISTTIFSTTQIRMKDPTDPAVTKGSIFCNPIAFQYYGPNHVFFNNTVVPNVEYMRMDSSKSNVNISNLSSTNTSILNDMTITRDLDVDRYLSYKPRFLTRWRDNVYGITGTAQDVQFNRAETAMAGGALQVSGDGIQALLAGWYRVDWSVGYRKLNNNGGERLTARTYLRINNVFYGKYGFGSTTYLRSSSINRIGFSSGSQLVYAAVNDIIHVRTDCIIQGNVDFTSDFNGQRILANSRFSCEYVSNSGQS